MNGSIHDNGKFVCSYTWIESAIPKRDQSISNDDPTPGRERRMAQRINHFEGTGIKLEKYGPPDKAKLAKEVMDVLRCGLQVAIYYSIEKELEAVINDSYQKMKSEGILEETGFADNAIDRDDG
jgi:hypothetical protein